VQHRGTILRAANDIVTTGEVTGRRPRAEALVAQLRRRVAAVESLPPLDPPLAVACIEWTDPPMVGGHWVPELVRRAGRRDPMGHERQPSGYVAWRDVDAAQPDVLVYMPCGYDLARSVQAARDVVSRSAFAASPRAGRRRVATVDGSSFFNRPGPRIVDSLAILATLLRKQRGEDLPAGASWNEVGSAAEAEARTAARHGPSRTARAPRRASRPIARARAGIPPRPRTIPLLSASTGPSMAVSPAVRWSALVRHAARRSALWPPTVIS